ncbi:oligopeptide ABC transporter permease [Bacillus testis]|uniref:oligopeptide ABC transporter permease n=1 Tax=Bacillus testis TaxID=1622072 RepID=UPI00067F5399|nr:oligopeptide ABC transporter permease [Bacillus testis]
MGRYIFQRVGYALVTFFLVATFSFYLMQTLPGSPFNDDKLSAAQKERLYEKYGLDEPISTQYIKYMTNIFKGDLGVSFQFDGRPVTTIISERIGPSAQLGIQALIVGTIIGIIVGIIAAMRHNTIFDYGAMLLSVLGIAVPSFVFAGFLQFWIGAKLQWLPVAMWNGFEYTIMPTITLAVSIVAVIARYMRTEMLEVLNQDYMMTAEAKGLSSWAIVVRHSIRNAIIPVITILGPLVVSLITGSLIIENIFGIPGLGEQFVQSILTNDYPIIMGTTLLYSGLFIVVTLLVDVMYGIIDPRIRLMGEGK